MLNSRPLALGSAGGGVVSALPNSNVPVPPFETICSCLEPRVVIFGLELDTKSLLIGLVLGYFLGPVIERL